MTSIYSKFFDKKSLAAAGKLTDPKQRDRHLRLDEQASGRQDLLIFRKSLERSFEELACKAQVLAQPKSPANGFAGAPGSRVSAAVKPEPLFILNIKLEDNRFGKLVYFVDQDPKTVAQDFCQKHLLERAGISYLETVIRSRKQQVLDEQRSLVQQRLSRLASGSTASPLHPHSMTLNEYTNMKTAEKQSTQLDRSQPTAPAEPTLQPIITTSAVIEAYSEDSDYESCIDSLLGTKPSPEKKKQSRPADEAINSGFKLHMKGIKLHEKEM